jgi:ribosome-binding protein aMBF1 (putative translation factor)
MEKQHNRMPSQFPALRLTLARQMEGYQERIARRIQKEAAKNGEAAIDLAQSMRVHPSTVERWFRAERTPQRRHRKELAAHWDLPLDVFEFDLEAEEMEVREQLSRIETKLDRLLAWAEGRSAEEVEAALDANAGQEPRRDGARDG